MFIIVWNQIRYKILIIKAAFHPYVNNLFFVFIRRHAGIEMQWICISLSAFPFKLYNFSALVFLASAFSMNINCISWKKNPKNVVRLSTMIAKHCVHVFLKSLKLKIYYSKGNNSFILFYLWACKCKHSSCLHLPCTAALRELPLRK